jgi:histidinol-phosphate/aromatic aminotransferase/cobyric acid decarboxylase-like protein
MLAAALGLGPESVLDLSLSLNPAAPDVAALAAVHADAVRTYPDPSPARLALATAMDVEPGRLLMTNGGSEAIALVAAERPVGWVDAPDFSLYARHLTRLEPGAARWRSNPHNPTGRLASRDEHAAVWDEAFYPLATGHWSRGDDDAIVVGSLTKLFACPGLRAGYILAPDADLATRLGRRQPEWSLNGIAAAVLPELLAHADLRSWAREVRSARETLVRILQQAGLRPEASEANYVLVREAPGLRGYLAARAILVRDTSSFGLPDGVRIAVPEVAGLDRLGNALEGWPLEGSRG